MRSCFLGLLSSLLFACSPAHQTTGYAPVCSKYKVVVQYQQGSVPEGLIFNALPVERIFNVNYTASTAVEAVVFSYFASEITQLEQRLRETTGILSVTIKKIW